MSKFSKQEKEQARRLSEATAYLRELESEVEETACLIALGNKAHFVAEELEDLVKQYKKQEKRVEKLEAKWHEAWRLSTYGKTASSNETAGR